jgi:DNA polymerase
VFLVGIRNLEDAGYRVIFHVHDEVVVETDASASRADVVRLLTTMPDWAKSLPVAAEAEETECYKK